MIRLGAGGESMTPDEALVRGSVGVFFALYYAIGFFVCLHTVDRYGRPMPWWHAVFVAIIWPVLFLMPFE